MNPARPSLPADLGPRLLALAGPSGSGKTTLAEHLVRTWAEAGLRVGYVKHASHGFQMDRPGKDSARLSASGAVGVAVTGPEGTAFLEPAGPSTAADLVRRFFPDADVVVVEGFRGERLATVLLAGEAARVDAPDGDASRVLAGYGPAARRSDLEAVLGSRPVFDREELDELTALLARWLVDASARCGVSAPGAIAVPASGSGARPALRLVSGDASQGHVLSICAGVE